MSGTEFSRGIPDKPPGLSSDESRYWDQLIDQLPAGVLKQRDSRLLRELCSALAISDRVAAITKGDPLQYEALDVYLAAVGLVSAFSPVFGMTPVDRENMDIEPDEPDDFVEWMEQE